MDRNGRAKRPVTIRLDVDVLEWLKSAGPEYQTKPNLVLRHAMVHLSKGGRGRGKRLR
ncbi:MAG TPA: BrnA antitoxin family protein [Candidatus Acidoferrum sp.]|nr:BrnA antitoxin family protein [Candidatus Acidoferrum sp.]